MLGDALSRTVAHAWTALARLGSPMALVGGVAMAAWGHARLTRDADVLLVVGDERVGEVLRALESAGLRFKRRPPAMPLAGMTLVQALFEPPGVLVDVQVDVLIGQSEFHREALARAHPLTLEPGGAEYRVLACEDLCLLKLHAGRLIDLVDAAAILRINRKHVDAAHLVAWARRLNLLEPLRRAWAEALPGEAFPEAPTRSPGS